MVYELRYRVGDEAVKSGYVPLSGDRESAVAQAKTIAQSLVFSETSVLSEFLVRGPNGEIIVLDVSRKRIPG